MKTIWKESDASQFKRYDKDTNGALIEYLRTRIPSIEGETIETVALSSKLKAGYEKAIDDLQWCSETKQKVSDGANGSYDSLTD